MKSAFTQVKEFNKDILGIAPRPKGLQSPDEAALSHKQLTEEAEEFLQANKDHDYIGSVDACIDSIVFAMGILYKLGVTETEFDTIFEIVMSANMAKKIGVKKGREGFGAADAIKPEGWVPPEELIAKVLEDMSDEGQ